MSDPTSEDSIGLQFRDDEAFARELDAADPLAEYRRRFEIPRRPDGEPVIYFCGNSLGLMPRSVRDAVNQELDDWAAQAVDAHFSARTPWYTYHEVFREPAAGLVGARPHEVVIMNGLTVNLHLLMATFYRPTRERFRILMEDCAFPSDTYAARTQLRWHGFDPCDGLCIVKPRAGEHCIRTEDVEAPLEREGRSIALVLIGGLNYFTGQAFDMQRIAAAAHAQGCVVAFDLAHAVGNIPLRLHDWNVDFAVWCSYKYLSGGSGAVAGAFVHERHARNTDLPRFGGWWGNDPQTRFRMHLQPRFVPVPSADAWQLSNPPILSLAALRASMMLFHEVGIGRLREKSVRLTGYLEFLLDRIGGREQGAGSGEQRGTIPEREGAMLKRSAGMQGGNVEKWESENVGSAYEIITPRDPSARGCQLSILVRNDAKQLQAALRDAGVVCDFRPPNVLRVAPAPFYNTFHEVWRFAQILRRHVS